MGNISAIHFQKSKDFQVFHNTEERPKYAIGGRLEANRSAMEARELKKQMIVNAIKRYKEFRGQKFQAKAYEWSAVCNIKPDTTMQDLERLAEHFLQKYGYQCYQIAIHRDEGHINDDGQKVINHHAHLEFITLDRETGKNRQRDVRIKELTQIQTEVAQILGMERGVNRRERGEKPVKRIEPRKYALMKELERKNIRELKEQKNKEYKELQDKSAEYIEILEHKNNDFEAKSNTQINNLNNEILTLKEQKRQVEAERKRYKDEHDHIAEEYRKLQALNKQRFTQEQLNAEIARLREEYKQRIQALITENEQLKTTINQQKSKIQALESKITHENKKDDTLLKKENVVQNRAISDNIQPYNHIDYEEILSWSKDFNTEETLKSTARDIAKEQNLDERRVLKGLQIEFTRQQKETQKEINNIRNLQSKISQISQAQQELQELAEKTPEQIMQEMQEREKEKQRAQMMAQVKQYTQKNQTEQHREAKEAQKTYFCR